MRLGLRLGFGRRRRQTAGVNALTAAVQAAGGLALWDAEQAAGLTLDGAAVSAWRDLLGNLSLAQSVAGSKPTFAAAGFNGRPVVSFDAGDCLEFAGVGSLPTGATGCIVLALVDQAALAADTQSRTAFAWGGTSGNNSRQLRRERVSSANRPRTRVGTGAASVNSDATADFSGRCLMKSAIGATETTTTLNGTAGSAAAAVPSTGTSVTRIGADVGGTAANFWSGGVSAIAVFPVCADVSAVETLLNARR